MRGATRLASPASAAAAISLYCRSVKFDCLSKPQSCGSNTTGRNAAELRSDPIAAPDKVRPGRPRDDDLVRRELDLHVVGDRLHHDALRRGEQAEFDEILRL